jgi:hypothetical protein
MPFKELNPSTQALRALDGAVLTSPAAVLPDDIAAPATEEEWAKAIRDDLELGALAYISAGRRLLAAKQALKGTNGSFTHLVTVLLGHSLDTAERWMAVAGHPVLADSANLRSLPTAWTTLHTLSRISPELLLQYIVDGTVHARLSGKEAAQLLKRSATESRDRDDDDAGDGDAGRDHGEDRHGDRGRDYGEDRHVDGQENHDAAPTGNGLTIRPADDPTIGSNSPGEIERKLARLGELERETRRQMIQLTGYESEVEELKAKLGPEIPIRAQRRLFQQALRRLQKSEFPGTLEKERHSLRQRATTDFVELIRSAIRDGLKPERLDLVYRPEVH